MKMDKTGIPSARAAERMLLQYDVVTFDVFDTLITRCVPEPSDIFAIVEARAKEQGILADGFGEHRRLAEENAYRRYGEHADFNQIYTELREGFLYTCEQSDALQELELDTELQLVLPRRDVRSLVEKLLAAGKRILLCSDMYLSSSAIGRLLKKCGYPDGLELWVSCEKKASKKNGDLWEQLFACLPADARVIHVGDNREADYRKPKELGREALWIPSGAELFRRSELYDYLSKYIPGKPGCSLLLGYLVNRACFNSPFSDGRMDDSLTEIWCGGLFACFMDFLVEHRDDSRLLFVTREGFLLKPMYERFCKALGVTPQDNTLCYASRLAALAASVSEAEDLQKVMLSRFEGTLGDFLENRLNYTPAWGRELYDRPIILPDDSRQVMELLEPMLGEIFENSAHQRDAYRRYLADIRGENPRLTVVDIGCNGTIQYGLSRILQEKVGGLYMFLNEKTLPERMGCACLGLRNPRMGVHPVYDNQLFLEAAMQAPCGQLKKMELEAGKAMPKFLGDAGYAEEIPKAQEAFCRFVEWYALWKRQLGSGMDVPFELAEDIWICLLKFRCLPQKLEDSFWIADGFSGNPHWKYDSENQIWRGAVLEAPLAFCLQKDHVKPTLKYRVKNYVKAHIPYFAYSWAQKVWHRYFNRK